MELTVQTVDLANTHRTPTMQRPVPTAPQGNIPTRIELPNVRNVPLDTTALVLYPSVGCAPVVFFNPTLGEGNVENVNQGNSPMFW